MFYDRFARQSKEFIVLKNLIREFFPWISLNFMLFYVIVSWDS